MMSVNYNISTTLSITSNLWNTQSYHQIDSQSTTIEDSTRSKKHESISRNGFNDSHDKGITHLLNGDVYL